MYRVVEDYQGGTFGFNRDYTIEEWREQAIEWATMDDNEDLIKLIQITPNNNVLDTISEIWQLKFRKVRKDKGVKKNVRI